MAVDVAGACFQWSHSPALPPNTSTSQTMASVFSSLSSSTGRGNAASDHAITHHALHGHRSPFLRSRSLDIISTGGGMMRRKDLILTRAISVDGLFSNTDDGEDDEFVNKLHQLASKLHQESNNTDAKTDSRNRNHRLPIASNRIHRGQDASRSFSFSSQPPWPAIRPDPPELPDLVPASVERNANSVDLPLSLRMIKRRKKTSSPEATATTTAPAVETPMKKAFSSMVFIIGELQRCTLQMRELLFVENLDGILARVHQEMHASFVWLFQQIFSCTPTLMLSLMLILASFTVHSMSFAAAAPPASVMIGTVEDHRLDFDPSSVKSFSVEAGRTASVGGGDGDGGSGKARPVAGDTDDWRSGGGISSSSYHGRTINSPDQVTTTVDNEEEARLWNRIVDEASRMQAALRGDALMDPEILQWLVSPVTVDVEPENQADYLQTELTYHQAIAQDPNNALLLCNFAQFLYLVLHDNDRAEYYFKRAVETQPADAEALSRYASFLWQAKNDLDAAEETYLEAIAVDPSNSFHAGNYAHFLWSTGGEDTCYPLD